jgi:hypothetical protein
MDYQVNTDSVPQGQPTLSEDDADFVRKFVLECERKGRDERKDYKLDWEECDRLYNCTPNPIEDEELDWQTNIVLPWAYDSAESWHAYLHSTMVPKRDEIFTLDGRTQEDHPGAEAMQKYMEFKLDQSRFQEFFGKVLRQLSRQNHVAVKRNWRLDKQTVHQWGVDEEVQPDGSIRSVKRKVSEDRVTYNGLGAQLIQLEDFVFYPIYGDIEKTTRIHRTYRYLEDLKYEADEGITPYDKKILDKISDDSEYKISDDKPLAESECKRKFQGVAIKEAWIHRLKMPDGKVYKNYIATLANDKYLIRFQKAPEGKSPFIWLALRPDGDCLYGFGLNSKGIGILNQASELFNQKMDEIKLRIHPPTKYYDDGVFNPYAVINRPGAFIRVSNSSDVAGGNLMPLMQDFTPIQIAFQELAELKVEFETVTVPKVVKGMIETQRQSTATEQNLAQNNASGKMHADAFHINENFLKPYLEGTYSDIYQRVNEDPALLEEMARLVVPAVEVITTDQQGQPLPQPITTQKTPDDLIAGLPEFLPLPDVDIQVVGYQNQVRKQEQLVSAQNVIGGLAQTPAANYLKWGHVAEQAVTLTDMDRDFLVMSEDERNEQDKNAQAAQKEQQDLLVAQEKAKLDLQAQKQQQDYDVKLRELALKELDLQLKYQADALRMDMEARRDDTANQNAQQEHALRGAEIASKSESKADSGAEK